MIYCHITIEISDPHLHPHLRAWTAIADAGKDLARIAKVQHDNVTQPPLPSKAEGSNQNGDKWTVEVKGSPF
mgnify:CR=1 FL=1